MRARRGNMVKNVRKEIKREVKKEVKKDVKKDNRVSKRGNLRRRRSRIAGLNTVISRNAPLARGYSNTYSKPTYKGQKDSILVTHSEYIGTLNASDAFSANQYRLNPTDPNTFPWLSRLANSYEKWEIKSLVVRMKANCSTTTYGKTFAYFDYDPNNLPVTDIGVVLNTMDAKSGSPWVDKTVPFRRQFNAPKQFLIRSPYSNYSDYILYDPANLYVGTVGSVNGSIDPVQDLCEIWIDYTIQLSIPDPGNQINLVNAVFNLTNVTSQGFGSTGNYGPNFSTATVSSYQAGNFIPTFGSAGIFFPNAFTGIVTIQLNCSNGFDFSRLLQFGGSNGAQTQNNMWVLNDETVSGDDEWTLCCSVTSPPGGFIFVQNALTTTSLTYTYCKMAFASSNPRFWNTPSTELGAFYPSLTAKKEVPHMLLPPKQLVLSEEVQTKPKKQEKSIDVNSSIDKQDSEVKVEKELYKFNPSGYTDLEHKIQEKISKMLESYYYPTEEDDYEDRSCSDE